MKKVLILSLCFVVMSSKCRKKEAKDYLAHSWGILIYKENGIDKTTEFNLAQPGYKITFDAKGNFTEYFRNSFGVETTITGTWTLENNDLQLTLVDNDPNSKEKVRVYTVLHEITESVLNIGITNKEYDFGKQ